MAPLDPGSELRWCPPAARSRTQHVLMRVGGATVPQVHDQSPLTAAASIYRCLYKPLHAGPPVEILVHLILGLQVFATGAPPRCLPCPASGAWLQVEEREAPALRGPAGRMLAEADPLCRRRPHRPTTNALQWWRFWRSWLGPPASWRRPCGPG